MQRRYGQLLGKYREPIIRRSCRSCTDIGNSWAGDDPVAQLPGYTIHTQLAGGGKNSLRAVLEKLQVRYVDEAELLKADPGLRSFFDLDTRDDMEKAKKIDAN